MNTRYEYVVSEIVFWTVALALAVMLSGCSDGSAKPHAAKTNKGPAFETDRRHRGTGQGSMARRPRTVRSMTRTT